MSFSCLCAICEPELPCINGWLKDQTEAKCLWGMQSYAVNYCRLVSTQLAHDRGYRAAPAVAELGGVPAVPVCGTCSHVRRVFWLA